MELAFVHKDGMENIVRLRDVPEGMSSFISLNPNWEFEQFFSLLFI